MRLDRVVLVRAALALLNEVGLDGLTLRRIAKELDVQAPALYWHFANKQALLDEMATTMARDLLAESGTPDPSWTWERFLAETARGMRAMMLAYRDGARVFSGTYLTDDSLLASMEIPLRTLVDAGFSLHDAVLGWQSLYAYTVGYVIEEQATHPAPGALDERYDAAAREARIDAERFPLTHAVSTEIFADSDGRFEHGLNLIIAGMRAQP